MLLVRAILLNSLIPKSSKLISILHSYLSSIPTIICSVYCLQLTKYSHRIAISKSHAITCGQHGQHTATKPSVNTMCIELLFLLKCCCEGGTSHLKLPQDAVPLSQV